MLENSNKCKTVGNIKVFKSNLEGMIIRMNLTGVQEEYLKTIYTLRKTEKSVRVTDIAKKLNKTKPTVNYAINNLKTEGLINYEAYGDITLTNEGEYEAQKILEAYDIMYIFLSEIIGLDKKKAEQEATKVKATLEAATLNKIAVYTHKTLGLYSLECGYDINNKKCLSCIRRKKV